ncbi:MAG: PAS domain S-box protein [Geobacteraceae bacterium]|nr:PAS domain S-box protein [Geobacteraceae bacterium]
MKSIRKYILASSLLAILTIILFGSYSLNQYQENEVSEEHEKLETCIRTFWELLAHKGTNFRVVDGQLLVDAYTLNNNFELPDKVQSIFGGVATVFMGNERVSTNVLNAEGERAVGTRLVGPAYDAIFKQGKPYRGSASILGIPYLTAYDPIRDRKGEVIGVVFVGVKESDFLARLNTLKTHLAMTLIGMVSVFSVFMLLLGRAMKRAEDANENQLRFQRTLMDTIPNPVFYKDAAGCYLGCNKAFEAFVGYTQNELSGKMPHELWPEELAVSYRQQDLALLENPGLQTFEATVRYVDGTLRDVIFNKATFEDGNGEVAGLVGVILDITERKAAEEATKNAYQQLWDIVEFLPDATFVVDKDKRVIAWNRAIEKMTGVDKEGVIGKGDYEYSIPFYGVRRPILIDLIDEDTDLIVQKYDYVTVEGRNLFAETVIPNFRGGADCHLWGAATPLFDSHGNQVGGIESIRDITEYKKAEQEKIRLESQLHQAQMMENVVIRLGHDLKSPLTPLFVMLSLLKKRLTEPDMIKKVDMCLKNATSIKNLADKASILATLTSRTKQYELETVSIASIVDQSLADCADLISQKQLDCMNNIDPSIVAPVVPTQLRVLFVNLISNAVQFSSEKSAIVVSAERDDEAVVISVRDDGIGINPAHLEHIFDEFFKVDESRHDLDTSGLGLSICKQIVRNHHGRIWAESSGTGKGTAIKFTINEHPLTPDNSNLEKCNAA